MTETKQQTGFFNNLLACGCDSSAPSTNLLTDKYKKKALSQPSEPLHLFNLGSALQERGNLTEAMQCYADALKIDPEYTECYYNTASALQSLGDYEKCIEFYLKAIAHKEDYTLAHYNLGYVFQDLGRIEDATNCFQRASNLEPNDVDIHINLGNCYRDVGDLEEAIRVYKNACKLDEENVMAHYNLASAYQERGDKPSIDSAIKHFLTTLKLDPSYVDAHFNLGIAYQDKQQFQAALKCYENTCLLDGDFAEAKLAAKSIREIIKCKGKRGGRVSTGDTSIRRRSRERKAANKIEAEKENRVIGSTPIKQLTNEHLTMAFDING